MYGSVNGLLQDLLQQRAGVQIKVALEDLSAAMDGMNPWLTLLRPPHAFCVSSPLVQVESSHHPMPLESWRKLAAEAVGVALAAMVCCG